MARGFYLLLEMTRLCKYKFLSPIVGSNATDSPFWQYAPAFDGSPFVNFNALSFSSRSREILATQKYAETFVGAPVDFADTTVSFFVATFRYGLTPNGLFSET